MNHAKRVLSALHHLDPQQQIPYAIRRHLLAESALAFIILFKHGTSGLSSHCLQHGDVLLSIRQTG